MSDNSLLRSFLRSTLGLLLALSLLLVSCAPVTDGPSTDNPSESITDTDTEIETDTETDTDTDNPPDKPDTFYVSDSYLPEAAAASYRELLSTSPADFVLYDPEMAPYAMQDVEGVTNCQILSLTLPIGKTLTADDNGNYLLTLYAFANSDDGLKQAAIRSWEIPVNRDAYALTDDSEVNRFLTLDLSAWEIRLMEGETLGIFAPTDTLYPLYLPEGALAADMAASFPSGVGYLTRVGSTKIKSYGGLLLCHMEIHQYYDSAEAYAATVTEAQDYEALVATLREKYADKKLSILGDSISTYGGVTNDASANATIKDNLVYHKAEAEIPSADAMYWGQLCQTLDMELCVANCFSGSRVFGRSKHAYEDSSVLRAAELDNDNGTPNDPSDDIAPDVIIFYMGINDLRWDDRPLGELNELLTAAEPEQYHDIIDAWWTGVLERTDNATALVHDVNYTNVTEAYALTLYRLKTIYPDAEILVMNLLPTKENIVGNTPERLDAFNFCFEALIDYFELPLVDLYELGIDTENLYGYSSDVPSCLHYGVGGHARILQQILVTLDGSGKQEDTLP